MSEVSCSFRTLDWGWTERSVKEPRRKRRDYIDVRTGRRGHLEIRLPLDVGRRSLTSQRGFSTQTVKWRPGDVIDRGGDITMGSGD